MNFGDEELMAMFAAGSSEAFDVLYERYRNRIFWFVQACLRDSAESEDVVQEVFLRISNARKSYQPLGRFKSWVFRIAANQIRTCLARQPRRTKETACDDQSQDPFHVVHPERLIQARDELDFMLAHLSEDQRSVLILREVEGMDSRAIGQTLGISPENVRVILHRARSVLVRMLEQEKERSKQ